MKKAIATLLIIAANSLFLFSQTKSVGQDTLNFNSAVYSLPFVQDKLGPADYGSGRMRLLRRRTGMSAGEIEQLYTHSGARLFGQFTCAVLVAQRLSVNREALLEGIRVTNILTVLESMGVEEQRAREAIMTTVQEIVAAEKSPGR